MKKQMKFQRFVRRNSTRIVNVNSSLVIFNQPKVNTIGFKNKEYKQHTLKGGIDCYFLNERAVKFPVKHEKFKLLVWNLHKGKDEEWQSTLRYLGDKCDFILLQEVRESNDVETLWPGVELYGVHAGSYAFRDNMSGAMLLSPYLPIRYFVGSRNEPWIRIPKINLAAIYPISEHQNLLLVNLHLVNFEWGGVNYLEQLKQAFKLISEHQGPLILAGDFNSWSKMRIELLNTFAKAHSLMDIKFENDSRTLFFGKPLDHIYVKGLSIHHADVIKTNASDHNPMCVTFTISD